MENILLDQVLQQVQNKEISIEKARELICVLFDVSQQRELVCRSYYPNNMSTGLECLNCGKGKHEH